MQPTIGVVGALAILQCATYVYESLFGTIQPSHESDSSPSVEDDFGPHDFANLTPKQRRQLRAEKCKPSTTGGARHKGESEERTPEERSTGMAEVTTGASSSSVPVEEISQGGPAQAIPEHQGASQTKDQPKIKLIQKKKDQDKEQKSVPSPSSKVEPKKTPTHKVRGLTSEAKEAGNREIQSSDVVMKPNTTTSNKGQIVKQSTSQVQEPTCDASVRESRGKGKDSKRHTCDIPEKNAPTTSSTEQPNMQQVSHDQSPTCVADACKKGGKVMEPKNPSSDNAAKTNVPMTSNNSQTKDQSSQRDQVPASGAQVGKKESKGKDLKKNASDIAVKNVPTTSFKEQPMRQAALQQYLPTCEAEVCEKGGKVVEPKKPSCDNGKKNVPTTSSKEQPKQQLTYKDQGLISVAENAKIGCKGKEPKEPTCANAKKSVPGTSSEEHRQSCSTLQDHIPTCKTHAGKKGDNEKEPVTHSCDDAKKKVSITSRKEHPKKLLSQKDNGHTQDAAAAQKGCNRDEAKKSSSGSTRKLCLTTSSKEHTENQPTQEDKGPAYKGPAYKAHTGTKRCKGEDTKKPSISQNPEKCVSTTSAMTTQPKKKQDHCEAFANKNKGKGRKPKEHYLDNVKDTDEPTTSHSKQLKQEPKQKDQGPTSAADAGKKEGKAQGVKSDTEKALNTSVTPDPCIAKTVETPCLPGNSTEVAENCANSIKASESEWTLVGKKTTSNKEKRKVGPSDKYEAGPKKPSASQTRVVKKTQSKSSAKSAQPKPGDKDQKAEEPPKKKRPTRRAKKKPKKGKLTPNDAVTSKKEASPVSIQEQCPTITKEASKAVADTWANIVKSSPNVSTPPPLQRDSKAPEIQDKETQKETVLGKREVETPWNVPVTHKKCIGHKKKALCVEQGNVTASSGIAETPSSKRPVNETSTYSLITQGEEMKDPANAVTPQQEQKWPVPPPVSQPTDFPITQGAGMKGSVRPRTEKPISTQHGKQGEILHLMDLFIPNFPVKLVEEREDEVEKTSAEHLNAVPITQEVGVKDSGRPGTETSISTSIVRPGEVLHLMDSCIPNFPVKLVEEREEEVEKTSAEHHNANSPIARETGTKDSVRPGTKRSTSAPLVKEEEVLHLMDSFIPNFPVKLVEERDEEVEKTSAKHHNADSSMTQEAGVKDTVRPGTNKHISVPFVKQEEVLHLIDSCIPNFPVKLVEEREEEVEKTSAEYHNAASSSTQEAGMKISVGSEQENPILDQHAKQGKELHMFDSLIPNYPVKLVEEREEDEKASTEHHDAVLQITQHESCTIIPTDRKNLMQDKPEDRSKSASFLITTATQTGEPATSSRILPAVLESLDQIRLTDQATCKQILKSTSTQTDEHATQTVKLLKTAASVQQKPTDHRLTGKSEGQKLVPATSTQDTPNTEFSQMSALSPTFVPSSTSPAVNPQTTLVKYIEDPTTQTVNPLMAATSGLSDHMLTFASQVERSLPVRYTQGMPATNLPQMSAFNPAYSLYPFPPVAQQHGNTSPAVNPPTLLAYVEDPSTLRCGTTYYQNYHYPAHTTQTWQMSHELTPYNAYSTYAPVHQQAVLSPMVEPYMRTTFPVVSLGVAPTTMAALPSSTCITKATALQVRKQQPYIKPAVERVVQKPDQVTSSKVMLNTNAPLEEASPSATKTPKVLKLQQNNTTPVVEQVGMKPFQGTSSNIMLNTSGPLEEASPSATKTPKAAAPLKLQQNNTTPAMEQVGMKPFQGTSSNIMLNTSGPLEEASPSATKTPKAATALLKLQQNNTTPAVEQVGMKPFQGTSSNIMLNTNGPLEEASPSATKTPKAAAALLKLQQNNTTPAMEQVGMKPFQGTSSNTMLNTNAPLEEASPSATKTPKAAAPLKLQQNDTTPAVEQVGMKPFQGTSSKVMLNTSAPLKEASPSATKTPKAAEPPNKQQTNTTLAVKQVGQKPDQVKFSKDMPNTSALLEKASPFSTKTPKAVAMLNQLQATNTSVYEQEVHKPGQVVLNATNTSQEQTTSVTRDEQTAIATVVKQPDNICHSLSGVNTFSQSVRPKERGPVAAPSSSKIVETSAINETGSTATGPKNSRSAKRRRARARQRQRERAEAEKRAKEADKKVATETSSGAATLVEETEGADSGNHHGEVASSSSSDIILNFDDDSEFVIDWDAEAAKPFYNSTEIFPPRVEIPDWAQWDFSQNERLQQLGRESHYK